MKIKKEQIILVVIILALLLYVFLRDRDRTHYQLPEVPEIPQAEISRIDISGPGGSIVLKKRDGDWLIGTQEYLADPSNVRTMLEFIRRPTLTAMVSESKNYRRYGLGEDKRIIVKAFSGNTLKREFEVGNPTTSYSHTFLKLVDDHRVYHAQKDIRSPFDKGVDELRDKTVLSLVPNEIQEIHITKGSERISMIRKHALPAKSDNKKTDGKGPETQKSITEWEIEGGKIDKSVPDSILSNLSKLLCREYLYNTRKEDLLNPIFSVTLKGKRDYALSIFSKKDKDENAYPSSSSENKYAFMLVGWKAEEIMKAVEKNKEKPDRL